MAALMLVRVMFIVMRMLMGMFFSQVLMFVTIV